MSVSPSDEFDIIWRRFRRDPRTNSVLDAYKFGLKAWPIKIRRKPPTA